MDSAPGTSYSVVSLLSLSFLFLRLRRIPGKHVVASFDRFGYCSRLIILVPANQLEANADLQTRCAPPRGSPTTNYLFRSTSRVRRGIVGRAIPESHPNATWS